MGKLNHHAIDNGDITSDVPVESSYDSVPYPDNPLIKSIDDDEMDHLLEFFHSEHDDDLLYVDLHMLQAWLVVSPPIKFFTVSTVLFHKDGRANGAIANFMSHFYMFFPTKATVKLANGNTGHSQVIVTILCCFTDCSIIYPVGPVYYCPGHPSSTISPGVLKFYVGFKKVTSEPLVGLMGENKLKFGWEN